MDGEEQKDPPLLTKICHKYSAMIKLGSTVLSYLNKIQKNIWIMSPPEFYWNQQILLYQKKDTLHFGSWFLILLTFLESLKIYLINLVIIWMMSAKMATPGLLKMRVFWTKGYDAIFPVYGVTNKILSHDSNYVVDMFMWSMFCNSTISMRKVITTSILLGFDQKNCFFKGWS